MCLEAFLFTASVRGEKGQGEGGPESESLGDSAANFCGQSVVSAQFPVNNFVPVERQKAGELFDAVAQQFQRNKNSAEEADTPVRCCWPGH